MTASLLPSGTTGVYVPIDDGHLDDAAALEACGFDTVWVAGGQIDSLERIDALLAATDSVRVATGIVPLGVYGTEAIAAHHARVSAAHPGRFVLGLGGPQQAKPLAALNAYLDELDGADVPAGQRMLAALGPRKLQVAADRSAGPITLLTTPESTAATRAAIGTDPALAVHQMTVLETDPGRARDAVRPTIGFLAQVGGYRANVRRMGFTDTDLDDLSNRLVDAVTAWGDAAAIARRVAEQRQAGADHVAVSIFPSEGGADVRETGEALATELF